METSLSASGFRALLDVHSDTLTRFSDRATWRSAITGMLGNSAAERKRCKSEFRSLTTALDGLGKGPKKRTAEGALTYEECWRTRGDRERFIHIAQQARELAATPIGDHRRDNAEDPELRQRPITLHDLADDVGYLSARPFSSDDARLVLGLRGQLKTLRNELNLLRRGRVLYTYDRIQARFHNMDCRARRQDEPLVIRDAPRPPSLPPLNFGEQQDNP